MLKMTKSTFKVIINRYVINVVSFRMNRANDLPCRHKQLRMGQTMSCQTGLNDQEGENLCTFYSSINYEINLKWCIFMVFYHVFKIYFTIAINLSFIYLTLRKMVARYGKKNTCLRRMLVLLLLFPCSSTRFPLMKYRPLCKWGAHVCGMCML